MMNLNYWLVLKNQRQAAEISIGLKAYLIYLYRFFLPAIHDSEKVLEVGSGAGTSIAFLESPKILRTDILNSDDPRILGNVDITSLPFASSEFDSVIGMDVIHHLQYPFLGLIELERVLNDESKSGIIVLIEPYVSIFSYLPYRLLHSEQTSLFKKRKLVEPLVGSSPEDGDQTLPRLIFCSKEGKRRLNEIFPSDRYLVSIRYVSIVGFFITGGINRPLPTPVFVINTLIRVENSLPQFILKILGSRMIITIRRLTFPQ